MTVSTTRLKKVLLTIGVAAVILFILFQELKYQQLNSLHRKAISFCSKVEKGQGAQDVIAMANANKEKLAVFTRVDRVTVKFERSSKCIAEIDDGNVKSSYVVYNE